MFDTHNRKVPVIFLKQNFQNIIFTPSRVDSNTQKWFRDHLKKWPFSWPDPLVSDDGDNDSIVDGGDDGSGGRGGRAHKENIESKYFKIYLSNFSCSVNISSLDFKNP
jgi:hypothetical protein